MTLARTVAAVAILMSSSATAWGQKRTDVVTLLNGDRITGEVISLNRGRLELKTDDAGTIDIEWNKIAGVEAARGFEIETEDGRRVLGSLARAADRGGMVVAASEGVVSLSMSEVTRITPIGTSFWRKLDGSLDAGFTYSQSSGIAQTTLNADTSYRRPAFVVRLDGSATLTTRRDDTERDDRGFMELCVRSLPRTPLVRQRRHSVREQREPGPPASLTSRRACWPADSQYESCAVRVGGRARGQRRTGCRRGPDAEHRGSARPGDVGTTPTTGPRPSSMRASSTTRA